ncbi:MAG: SDR family NAD(P)-dependent oxidoreductase, partial [Betaproteobacteria bacterium]|nr:SDR family NAD(P)-dependent oxidoreductase [Betaproteobacteria bacterium]
MNQTSLQAQVALVTGATRGIGAAIAKALAEQGVRVVGTATTEAGAQTIAQALSTYPGCLAQVVDVNDGSATDALVDRLVKDMGGLQILVNNAG